MDQVVEGFYCHVKTLSVSLISGDIWIGMMQGSDMIRVIFQKDTFWCNIKDRMEEGEPDGRENRSMLATFQAWDDNGLN